MNPTHVTLLAVWLGTLAAASAGETFHVDPAQGTADGDGSASRPWRTLAEAVADGKLAGVKGGDTVLLYDGAHGDVSLAGDNEATLTIAAAKGHRPRLSRFEITQGKRWLVRGLTVSPAFADQPYKGNIVSIGEGGPSSELTIEDCFVYTALDSSSWTVKEWLAANSGVWLGRHGTNLAVRNTHVLNTRFGINLCAPDSLCEGNLVANFSGDGIRVTRDGLTVQWNVIKNAYVSDAAGDANHDDAIQCFLFNKGTGTVRRVTIRGNIIVNREDDRQPLPNTLQGIGCFDGPLVEFLVEQNVVLTSHWHGISLYDAQGCQILDNVVFTRWTDVRLRPWVMLGQKQKQARGNVVQRNYAHSFDLAADAEVTEGENLKVSRRLFERRLRELEKKISKAFGRIHPVSDSPRLGGRPKKKRRG